MGFGEHVAKTVSIKPQYKAAIRHALALLCPQGAFGRWLLYRFHPDLGKEVFPDPLSAAWNELPVFPESRTNSSRLGGATTHAGRLHDCRAC